MVMIPSEINSDEIKDLINSQEFNVFIDQMENQLDIKDVEYGLELDEIGYDKEGFPDSESCARLIFKDNCKAIDKVFFYVENIKYFIDKKFFRLSNNDSIFYDCVKIYLKFLLIHEMVHIQQFKQGRISKQIKTIEEIKPYEERLYEIEANNTARNIMSELGEFEAAIADMILNQECINNEDVSRIERLYV